MVVRKVVMFAHEVEADSHPPAGQLGDGADPLNSWTLVLLLLRRWSPHATIVAGLGVAWQSGVTLRSFTGPTRIVGVTRSAYWPRKRSPAGQTSRRSPSPSVARKASTSREATSMSIW